ncbi:MAG TPA: hypothetical protein VJN43_04065 [Bryobacteraceae bacterium]|nr:hypothetical protein [Bryobacteraceae bacterium]
MNRSRVRLKWFLCICGQLLLLAPACFAQSFTQRGFLETDLLGYPQTAAGDSGRAVGGAILDYDASYKLSPSLIFSGGIEARTDTHHEVDREFGLSYWDRGAARPAFSIKSLNATYTKGLVTVELGKQFVRWGKADILNPTDRFAPQDYVDVVNSEFLGITAARFTIGDQSNTAEFVWAPRFTPSRIPLIGQRWIVIPALPFNAHPPVLDGGAQIPGGQQFGARWNHIGQVAEFSFSFYEGYNHLPLVDPTLLSRQLEVYLQLRRRYPSMRMEGTDAAIPLRWFTVKTEAAYFSAPNKDADDYAMYVVQLERQKGEWLFVGGYAGQYVTVKRTLFDFAPDRGLTRAFLGRASYNIDPNRTVVLETAMRQDGGGSWAKLEYTQAYREHWRFTTGFTWIRGEADDFLGQYHRNSFASLAIRYSF